MKGQIQNVGLIAGVILTLLIISGIAPFVNAILFDAGHTAILNVNSTNATLYGHMMNIQVTSFSSAVSTMGILFSVLTLGAVFSIIAVLGLKIVF